MPLPLEQKLIRLGIVSILVYATVHLLEEGLLGFPAWAEKSWGIPGYTVERWLIHNYFFLGTQLLLFLIYIFSSLKRHFLVLGLLTWGVLNTLNHSIFALLQMKFSPGLLTGFLFLLFYFLGVRYLKQAGALNKRMIFQALGIGILLWIVPIILFLCFDIFVLKVV